jgi:hypothetical protein
MKCTKAGCKDDVMDNSENWGWGILRCAKHFDGDARAKFRDHSRLDHDFKDDYFRLALMLEKKDGVIRDSMLALGRELSHEQKRALANHNYADMNKYGYVRFSAILAKYENMCWFPPSHHVFLGFAFPENFHAMLKQGILAKDPGAGPKHGDFSHRLQWHAVSRVITNNFTTPKRVGWNHTPLELLSSFGSDWAVGANAWASVFEKNYFWGNPDALNAELQKTEYGLLHEQISRRTQKRFRQYRDADPGGPGYADDLKTDRYFDVTGRAVTANVSRKLESGRYEIDHRYQNKKRLRTKKPGIHEAVLGEPVAKNIEGGAGTDVMPIEQRIALSRGQLCLDGGVFCNNLGILDERRRANRLNRLM